MSTTFDIATGEPIDEREIPCQLSPDVEEQMAPEYLTMLAPRTIDEEAQRGAATAIPTAVACLNVEHFFRKQR